MLVVVLMHHASTDVSGLFVLVDAWREMFLALATAAIQHSRDII